MASDECDDRVGISGFNRFRGPHVHPERRCRRMNYDEIVILGLINRLLDSVVVRWSIKQSSSGDHPRRIRKPRWIPKGPDLSSGLVARSRTSIEVIVRGRIQEESLHEFHNREVSPTACPLG